MRSITAKTMYEVTNNMSMTRDQAIYMACGGVLAFSSFEWPKKCSVDQEKLDNIQNEKKDKTNAKTNKEKVDDECKDANVDDNPNSTNYDGLTHEEMKKEEAKFTWKKVMEKYKKRAEELKDLNLYKWVVDN